MEQQAMIALVERHLKAEGAGDVAGATAVYTEDVIHDGVGFPGSPRTGKDSAADFYRFLAANFRTEHEEPLHRWFSGDTMFLEQTMTGRVIGEMLGIPGHDRRITFRIFHVFEFARGLISREQVWIDTGSIMAQLSAPAAAHADVSGEVMMTETPTTRPSFFGGVAEHLLFVVALCRLEHHTLPLALLHYVTWSVVGVALHVLAFTVGGPLGPVVLALALTAWALRFDVPVGIFFGLMQAAFAWTTLAIVRERFPASGVATSGLALAAIVAAIVTEVSGHHVFQGYGPPPPARIIAGFSRRQQAAFVPYFVVTFGLFFLTLDLAMRLLGYRRDLNGRANAVAVAWHEGIVGAAGELGTGPRELQLHRRAIAELS